MSVTTTTCNGDGSEDSMAVRIMCGTATMVRARNWRDLTKGMVRLRSDTIRFDVAGSCEMRSITIPSVCADRIRVDLEIRRPRAMLFMDPDPSPRRYRRERVGFHRFDHLYFSTWLPAGTTIYVRVTRTNMRRSPVRVPVAIAVEDGSCRCAPTEAAMRAAVAS